MPQGQKPLCLIHFGRVSFSHFQPLLLPLWGNKNWFIMGGWEKRWKNLGTKSVQQAAKSPVRMLHILKPLDVIHFWVIPIFPFSSPAVSFLPLSAVIRNRSPQYER